VKASHSQREGVSAIFAWSRLRQQNDFMTIPERWNADLSRRWLPCSTELLIARFPLLIRDFLRCLPPKDIGGNQRISADLF